MSFYVGEGPNLPSIQRRRRAVNVAVSYGFAIPPQRSRLRTPLSTLVFSLARMILSGLTRSDAQNTGLIAGYPPCPRPCVWQGNADDRATGDVLLDRELTVVVVDEPLD